MTVLRAFSFEHNVRDAVEQDYRLAYQQMDQVRWCFRPTQDGHVERYLDAEARLDQARERLLRG